jgi:hypothetical protein
VQLTILGKDSTAAVGSDDHSERPLKSLYIVATGYLRGCSSTHVGVVPLQPFAKAEPPACSDLQVDPVRAQRAPGGDPAIGGDHHAVDEAGTAEPVEADALIRLLHDQQRGVAATDSQEIGAAEEHGVVAE